MRILALVFPDKSCVCSSNSFVVTSIALFIISSYNPFSVMSWQRQQSFTRRRFPTWTPPFILLDWRTLMKNLRQHKRWSLLLSFTCSFMHVHWKFNLKCQKLLVSRQEKDVFDDTKMSMRDMICVCVSQSVLSTLFITSFFLCVRSSGMSFYNYLCRVTLQS